MQYLVLFLAIVLLGVALVVGFRPGKASARRADGGAAVLGLYEPEPVLPPVLLPEQPRAVDIEALRLSPALRGYRCDQVDDVLDALGAEVERLHVEIERLRSPREQDEAERVELSASWGPEASEPEVELATEAEPGVEGAPVGATDSPATGPIGGSETVSSAASEAPAGSPSGVKEGPFDDQSPTFRSV
ncbi:MAG: DivIVA domain-containing protein [Arthrobacter sp.]|jgi:DivIVA domain-containing protein|nr:DivIVA domain-containing protein [Arthrobacter sp.]